MGYYYTLYISPFEVKDSEEFLGELKEAAPYIAEGMCVELASIIFDPDDSYAKWRCEEDLAIPVIQKHLKPLESCTVEWVGEDESMGGTLVTSNGTYPIEWEPFVYGAGEYPMPLDEAEQSVLIGKL